MKSGKEEESGEENDDRDVEKDESKKDGIYRPPKLVPVYNDIDETPEDRTKKQIERIKRKAFNSSIIKDSGAPEEIRVNFDSFIHFPKFERVYLTWIEFTKNNFANILENETNEQRHKTE